MKIPIIDNCYKLQIEKVIEEEMSKDDTIYIASDDIELKEMYIELLHSIIQSDDRDNLKKCSECSHNYYPSADQQQCIEITADLKQ